MEWPRNFVMGSCLVTYYKLSILFQPTKINADGCPLFKKDSACPVLVKGAGCPVKDKAAGCPLFSKDATCSYLKKTPGCPFLSGVSLPWLLLVEFCRVTQLLQLLPISIS